MEKVHIISYPTYSDIVDNHNGSEKKARKRQKQYGHIAPRNVSFNENFTRPAKMKKHTRSNNAYIGRKSRSPKRSFHDS
jgi:hypothetical protein